tara:strand:+ start:5138 stop:5968 length:831 start_codon:yes stop_codon:yes gene_type:complete
MNTYSYILKRQESPEVAGEGKARFVASTSSADRYGDIINQKGWDLSKYRNNPIVLLNHDSNSLPIGRGVVEVKDEKLFIDVEFDMGDPKASEVARKTKEGYINAVSVGFQPLQAKSRYDLPKDSPYYAERGTYYDKAELLEVSIVTIPANAEAVMAKEFNSLRDEIIREVRSVVRGELLAVPNVQLKHIISVREEDDKFVVEFAKHRDESSYDDEELAMEEEEEKAATEEEKEDMAMEEEEDKSAYDDEEEKRKEDEEEKQFDSLEQIAKAIATLL